MTIRVMHIAEVGLRVTDLSRALAFYQEVLGLEIVRAYPTMAFLKAGELDSPLGLIVGFLCAEVIRLLKK